MKRIAIILAVCLAAAMLLTAVAAVGQTFPRGTTPAERQQERQHQASAQIKERIDLIIARFNNNKDRHIAVYNATRAKVVEIVTAMTAKGYDTTKLQSDLQTWDQMVQKAAADYATFISLLQSAEQFTPLESGGQFWNAINQARAQLRVFRQDSLDVRSEYQTVIRPDVAALASQTPKAPATTAP
jgi:hypothetical protein